MSQDLIDTSSDVALSLFLDCLEQASLLWNKGVSQKIENALGKLDNQKKAGVRYASKEKWHEQDLNSEDWERMASAYNKTISGYEISASEFEEWADNGIDKLSEELGVDTKTAKNLVYIHRSETCVLETIRD